MLLRAKDEANDLAAVRLFDASERESDRKGDLAPMVQNGLTAHNFRVRGNRAIRKRNRYIIKISDCGGDAVAHRKARAA